MNEAVLRKVLEWCEHHKNDPATAGDDESDSRKKTTDIDEWDQKFMQVDQEMLFEIILVSAFVLIGFLLFRSHMTNHQPPGCKLSRHQTSSWCWMQNCCKYDQGQISWGNPQDF